MDFKQETEIFYLSNKLKKLIKKVVHLKKVLEEKEQELKTDRQISSKRTIDI